MSQELAPLSATHYDSRLDELQKVIPTGDRQKAEHMARMVLTAINKTPGLLKCTPESRLACLFDIVSIGLPPNTPHGYCYLIPYGNQCTLQIGYKGFAKLAYDSNQVKMIKSGVVREGDKFEYVNGTDVCYVRHTESLSPDRFNSKLIATWASVELLNGGVKVEVMTAEESNKILGLSKSPAAKAWQDEFRKKSVLKRALKTLQIGGMDVVTRAVEIDNKNIPALPPRKVHALTFDDDTPSISPEEHAEEQEQPPGQSEELRDPETGEYLF